MAKRRANVGFDGGECDAVVFSGEVESVVAVGGGGGGFVRAEFVGDLIED